MKISWKAYMLFKEKLEKTMTSFEDEIVYDMKPIIDILDKAIHDIEELHKKLLKNNTYVEKIRRKQ